MSKVSLPEASSTQGLMGEEVAAEMWSAKHQPQNCPTESRQVAVELRLQKLGCSHMAAKVNVAATQRKWDHPKCGLAVETDGTTPQRYKLLLI